MAKIKDIILQQNNEAQNNVVDGEILNQVQDGNIEEIKEDIAQPNNEVQNDVDGEILNQAQDGNMEPENLQLAVVRGNARQNEHHGNFAIRGIKRMIDNPITNYVRNHPIQAAIVAGAVVVASPYIAKRIALSI